LPAFILPLVLALLLPYLLLHNILFGFFGLVMHVLVLYYCLGPQNPFYPIHPDENSPEFDKNIGAYFAEVNGELFAPIFWYMFTGIFGVLVYRLISLCATLPAVRLQASQILLLLDWLPARLTALLYLLVGNFQRGFAKFKHWCLTLENNTLLSECGLKAVKTDNKDSLSIVLAEYLVEQAVILNLVLLAIYTVGTNL
jgi:AmpE protein